MKLYSQIREPEEKFHIIPNPGIAILFHGVAVTQEPDKNINDVWFSDELSGPYVCQYQTDAEKK